MRGTSEGVQAFESFVVLDVPNQVISKVARIVATAEKMGIKIRWLDKVIDDYVFGRTTSSGYKRKSSSRLGWRSCKRRLA